MNTKSATHANSLTLFLMVLLYASAPAQAAPDVDVDPYKAVPVDDLVYVHRAPSNSASIFRSVGSEATLTVLAKNGGWNRVRLPYSFIAEDEIGYVQSSDLRRVAEPGTGLPAQASGPDPTIHDRNVADYTAIVTASSLVVRPGPGMQWVPEFASLRAGTPVRVTHLSRGSWVRISHASQMPAYVYGEYLQRVEESAAAGAPVDCRSDLSCTINHISDMPLQARLEWFERYIVDEYGVSANFTVDGNWFANIQSVLNIAPGRFEDNPAFNLIDAFILHAVQDGLRRHLGRSKLDDLVYGENDGGNQWHRFFDSLQGGSYDDQRMHWGIAEQLATNHGRRAASEKNLRLDEKTYQLLIRIGDDYRRLVAHRTDAAEFADETSKAVCAAGAGLGVAGLATASFCESRVSEEIQKLFDPRTPGQMFELVSNLIWFDNTVSEPGINPSDLYLMMQFPLNGSKLVDVGQYLLDFDGSWDWPCALSGLEYCGFVPDSW